MRTEHAQGPSGSQLQFRVSKLGSVRGRARLPWAVEDGERGEGKETRVPYKLKLLSLHPKLPESKGS